MDVVPQKSPAVVPDAIGRSMRGSLLLFGGRLLSLALDFLGHVLVVRYLAKDAFGSYAYALALTVVFSSLLHLGLPESVARFVPLFRSQGREGHALGAVAFATAVVLTTGSGLVLSVLLFPGAVGAVIGDPVAARLLRVLSLVVPFETASAVLQGLFASLDRTRIIFWRQHVLVPLLRLGVVLVLVVSGAGVATLAAGYAVATGVGLSFYALNTRSLLREHLKLGKVKLVLPVRAMASFAAPVLLSGLFYVLIIASGSVALGRLADAADVAVFQAVAPPARLNYLALAIFLVLFVPTLAALHASDDREGLRRAYTLCVAWMVVLTAPVLVLTVAFAPGFVEALFGDRYAGSGAVLALLSIAYYVQTVTGLNDVTLRVHGRLRQAVAIDCAALVAGIALTIALVLAGGAVGAAAAALAATLFRAALYGQAVGRGLDLPVLRGPLGRLQATLGLLVGAFATLELSVSPPIWTAVIFAGIGGAVCAWSARETIEASRTFPARHGSCSAFADAAASDSTPRRLGRCRRCAEEPSRGTGLECGRPRADPDVPGGAARSAWTVTSRSSPSRSTASHQSWLPSTSSSDHRLG